MSKTIKKLPSIEISGTVLSDLFFNHENPTIESCDGPDSLEKAIEVDAKEFAELIGRPELASDLALDYQARL